MTYTLRQTAEIHKDNGVYKAEYHGAGMWALLFRTKRAKKFQQVGWLCRQEAEPTVEQFEAAIAKHVEPFVAPIPGKLYRLF